MGVLPRKTMAWSANTRPRISGAASICTIAVDVVRNEMLPAPTISATGNAHARLGTIEKRSIAVPKNADARATSRTSIVLRRADHSAPSSEPRLSTENSTVNMAVELWNVRVTMSG